MFMRGEKSHIKLVEHSTSHPSVHYQSFSKKVENSDALDDQRITDLEKIFPLKPQELKVGVCSNTENLYLQKLWSYKPENSLEVFNYS